MENSINLTGITSDEAEKLQKVYGKNSLNPEKKESLLNKVLHVICEPMFLLLIAAAAVYFILGEAGDGAVMLVFVSVVIGIDVIQEWKTDKTIKALKDLSAPRITVLRDGNKTQISSEDLVPGDLMMIHEGIKIPADGVILKCNDLCVDESSLTGEAEGVWKKSHGEGMPSDELWRQDYCYAGTLAVHGDGVVLVEKTGARTEYGKIGAGVALAPLKATPLQKQIRKLVKLCAAASVFLFMAVVLLTFFNAAGEPPHEKITKSLLSGITLAMAMIPEELPVVFTVFLSMGAWRLAKKNSLVRKLASVETLGAVSVLCVDKTGTITKNEMSVQSVWDAGENPDFLIETLGLACETGAYDPMEKAMLSYCEAHGFSKENLFCGKTVKEYPFTNKLKMMGHAWKRNGKLMVAAKGSPESILKICGMGEKERRQAKIKAAQMSGEGLRVIAVATAEYTNEQDLPEKITDCSLRLVGLVGLWNPLRDGIEEDIEVCRKAEIRVVMITGDNALTAASIAEKIGIDNVNVITGSELDFMSDEELCEKVRFAGIFARVVPEHKMRIVKALKENGEIVAMTGDGVNDAPALKYADIGIAMGKKGSEVSREAADLILTDDNFTTIVETIKDGRRIYDNLKKAVSYLFTIHIPIALSSLLGPLLGIAPYNLMLLPIHVVMLELIIDPTCSIVLERQPPEPDIMERGPRSANEKLADKRLLVKSLLQGVVIFAASFLIYFYAFKAFGNASYARAMGFAVIVLSNLFLLVVNFSDYELVSFKKLFENKVFIAVNTLALIGLFVALYSPLSSFLKLAPMSFYHFLLCVLSAAVSVFWYEAFKFVKRRRKLRR